MSIISTNEEEQAYVGGQAVIEGVMMRSPRALAVAVRKGNGSIIVREDVWVSLFERIKFLRWPFLRGSVVLIESLYNGIQALNFSAQHAEIESDSTNEALQKTADTEEQHVSGSIYSESDVEEAEPAQSPLSTAFTIGVSLLMAFGLFKGLPHFLTVLVDKLAGSGVNLSVDQFGFHALDGVFKLSIFVAYVSGISMIPEIRRVFQYHGAEHKSINAYEQGLELTLENARKQTTFHARCGTSFVLFVLVLSIFVFAAVFPFVPRIAENEYLNHVAMLAFKVPLMLPLAGLAYEINRYAARHPEQFWVQALVVPGALMQKITTKEPDDEQLEIALSAMRAAIHAEDRYAAASEQEARQLARSDQRTQVRVFRDFSEVPALASEATR
ncbi:MAG: DUF1385 domain-containing protein [Myxococcota bacterium]|nr:DUF1385 domain-containing protein [Myxococcota bacterium]